MEGHAVAPDGSPAFDDDKRAAGDGGQGRQGLGGGDGRGDGDGVDDVNGHGLALLHIIHLKQSFVPLVINIVGRGVSMKAIYVHGRFAVAPLKTWISYSALVTICYRFLIVGGNKKI